jgi:serine protease Do
LTVWSCAVSAVFFLVGVSSSLAESHRRTPIVEAVETARPAVVNIHGQKTVEAESETSVLGEATRQVNGMGTGVVVDPRGYIITNYHVIEGVRRIHVTLADRRTYIARLVARDAETDLAIIKIKTPTPLPQLKTGTSSDLMPGEPVIAVGNAYGYHHTVTHGIISAVGRVVEVTESQKYFDLIQTDASINPGNSGGPLLNADGEMIGINVAVRVGAQGIGFAIPVDTAMEVAARLLSAERLSGVWHGISGETKLVQGRRQFVVDEVREASPAAAAGVRPGDCIAAVGKIPVQWRLDIERAVLGLQPGTEVPVRVNRKQGAADLSIVLASAPSNREPTIADEAWQILGVRLAPVPADQLPRLEARYNGGLRVTAIHPDGLAARHGVRPGDVIVGMHVWETVSLDDLAYVLHRADLNGEEFIRFYVVRDDQTRVGQLPKSWR